MPKQIDYCTCAPDSLGKWWITRKIFGLDEETYIGNCCKQHDIAYALVRAKQEPYSYKLKADIRLGKCIAQKGRRLWIAGICYSIAVLIFGRVALWGWKSYFKR